MASGSITSWQIDEETVETVTDFIFLSSKITADDDHSHTLKETKVFNLSNCGAGEDSGESLGQQGDQTSLS